MDCIGSLRWGTKDVCVSEKVHVPLEDGIQAKYVQN